MMAPPNVQAPQPSAAPAPVTRPLSPPPPAFSAPQPAPLTIPRTQTPLPKVQVPRVLASDLRLPEVQAPSEAATAAPAAAAPAGVTSLSGGLPTTAGSQQGASTPNQSGGGSGGGPPAVNGQPSGGGGSPGAGSTSPTFGDSGISGSPTGRLPRRPGGPSVRQPFPTGDSNTIIGKMDKTFDCSRLNRERDARCPTWDPIEGRNSRGAASLEVPSTEGFADTPQFLLEPIHYPFAHRETPGNQWAYPAYQVGKGLAFRSLSSPLPEIGSVEAAQLAPGVLVQARQLLWLLPTWGALESATSNRIWRNLCDATGNKVQVLA